MMDTTFRGLGVFRVVAALFGCGPSEGPRPVTSPARQRRNNLEPFVHGAVVDIVRRLHPEVDVVVSGHTHSLVQALIPNRGGVPTVVTHALFSGTALAKIDLAVDPITGDVVDKQTSIRSAWRDQPPGNQDEADIAELVSRAHSSVKGRTERLVGEAEAAFSVTLDLIVRSRTGR